MTNAVAAMTGRWRPRDSSVVVDISYDNGVPRVNAVDTDDDEQLEILDLEYDEESVCFTMVTPSTGWTVQHRLSPQENGAIACTTTILDSWERVS